jgi:hypothetical protein
LYTETAVKKLTPQSSNFLVQLAENELAGMPGNILKQCTENYGISYSRPSASRQVYFSLLYYARQDGLLIRNMRSFAEYWRRKTTVPSAGAENVAS